MWLSEVVPKSWALHTLFPVDVPSVSVCYFFSESVCLQFISIICPLPGHTIFSERSTVPVWGMCLLEGYSTSPRDAFAAVVCYNLFVCRCVVRIIPCYDVHAGCSPNGVSRPLHSAVELPSPGQFFGKGCRCCYVRTSYRHISLFATVFYCSRDYFYMSVRYCPPMHLSLPCSG